jgi:hypothetical protein
MRIVLAALLVASASPASADDDCAGTAAKTEQCSALWPVREGTKPAAVTFGWTNDTFNATANSFSAHQLGFINQIGQVEPSRLAAMHGNGGYLDARFHFTAHFYWGVDLRAAWGDPPRSLVALSGGEMMSWNSAVVFARGSVAGVRWPLGRVSIRAELFTGVHGATLGTTIGGKVIEADAVAGLIEPRVGAELWFSPWWAVEGFVGVNALDRTEQVFGAGLGGHFQAFDGRYR